MHNNLFKNVKSIDILEVLRSTENIEKKRAQIKQGKESALNKTEEIFAIDGKYIQELGEKYRDKETNFFTGISYFDQLVNAVLFVESIYRVNNLSVQDLKIKTINRSINDYTLKHIAERYLRKLYNNRQKEKDRKMILPFQNKKVKISPSGYISKDAMTAVMHYYDFKIQQTKLLTRFFNLSRKILKIDKIN